MRRVPALALAVAAGAAFTTANAQQFQAARPATPKTPATLTTPTTGGFLGGTDDCNVGLTNIGTGTQTGVPFTTGTTGGEGQNEANCYFFGLFGIEQDVWYTWTAATTGNVQVSSCAGTTVDTKMAIWPGGTGCPADGTSLACNDDACGLQTTVGTAVTAGTSYRIQVGTFPGSAGGAGTFDVNEVLPPPCGQLDNGATTNSLGLIAGGETLWMHADSNVTSLTGVSTAYGAAIFPGSVTNGVASQIGVWATNDPTTAGAAAASLVTTVTNGDTDILNPNPTGPVSNGTGLTFGASADQLAGQFPAPMDESASGPEAWVAGSTTGPGTVDINNINGANVPPLNMAANGFAAYFLLRADGAVCGTGATGTPLCFGAGCPCGNDDATAGCANTTGSGALLDGSGTPSFANDTVVLTATNAIPSQPGLFFQGNMAINGGNGVLFGNGLRCCGTDVIRLTTVTPDGSGCAASDGSCGTVVGGTAGSITQNPAQIGNGAVDPGETKCYQYWYRDPAGGGACGLGGFSLTNAYEISWSA